MLEMLYSVESDNINQTYVSLECVVIQLWKDNSIVFLQITVAMHIYFIIQQLFSTLSHSKFFYVNCTTFFQTGLAALLVHFTTF